MTRLKNKRSASRDYLVRGMTCAHCASSVREQVSEVPGVARADVELSSGRLSVSGAGINDDAVRAAVAEAGYWVAS